MKKSEIILENSNLKAQLANYQRAYDNIIIIQESILKGIKQLKSEKRKIKKENNLEKFYEIQGHLKCLYKMLSWINMRIE
jgi:hypothetical protein